MTETELLNFRIPTHLKQRFQDTCKNRNVAMTSVLCEAIYDYVTTDTADAIDGSWEPIMLSTDDFEDFR